MDITINGQKIVYTLEGEGSAVVLLHGWGSNRKLFDGIINVVSKGYMAIAPDFPGFGDSPEPKEPWGVGDYAQLIVDFLSALNIKKVIFLGHSFGGRVIFKLFERGNLPFEIEKIILIDSAGVKPKKTLKQKVKLKMYKISKSIISTKLITKLFPDALEKLRQKNGSADYNAASPIMRQCLVMTVNEDLTHVFETINVPSLIIWGEYDVDTPLSDAKLMEEKIPDAGLVICEGAGHYSFLEQPIKCQRVVASFLNLDL